MDAVIYFLLFFTKFLIFVSAVVMIYAGALLMLNDKEIGRAMEQLSRFEKVFPGSAKLFSLRGETRRKKWWNTQCWFLFTISVFSCLVFTTLIQILENYPK